MGKNGEINELPQGWTEVNLIDLLLTLESGSRPKGGVRGILEGVPSVGGEHLNDGGGFDFSNIKFVSESFAEMMNRGKIERQDILIVKDGATTGKVSFVSDDFPYDNAVVNEHVFICRPSTFLNAKYLFWFLWCDEGNKRILVNFKGSAQGGINTGFASNCLIPLAPLPEQKRIVAKLDELLGNLQKAQSTLNHIPQMLKAIRQKILTAAVSGELTKEKKLKDVTLGETTIQIPENWKLEPFQNLITELKNGIGLKPSLKPPGFPILRIGAVRSGIIDYSDHRFYNVPRKEVEDYFLKENDLLFTRYNGSLEFLGVCARVKNLNNDYVYPDKLMRVRLKDELLPEFAELYFQTEHGRKEVLKNAKSSAGQNGISGKDLKDSLVVLPPISVQQAIIKRVATVFTELDSIESRYLKLKHRMEHLPQMLLAQAFRGELVPQNSKDEPAEKLLERIKQEKEKKVGQKLKQKASVLIE